MNFASSIIQIFKTLDTLHIQQDHNIIFCREYGTWITVKSGNIVFGINIVSWQAESVTADILLIYELIIFV
jgi:hypothetical protein